jgi:prepilin-type N-terminal cleavage/methylation domain-containing protein
MNVQQKNKEKGFTIIEVVLVLAIAGLIFLMVFIALPALQRGQRDTQRREDVSRFASQLTSYSTNNRGSLPKDQAEIDSFMDNYMNKGGDTFADPSSGDAYDAKYYSGTAGDPVDKEIQYVQNATCNGEAVKSGGGNRQAAIRVKLEGSGFFCQNAK